MILELLSVGLVISACLAIFLDEAVYSVAALAGTFFLTSVLYALTGAVFVAVFQFAVGAGTLAILFLSGEMLSATPTRVPQKTLFSLVAVGVLLSLPAIFFSVSDQTVTFSGVSFEEAVTIFYDPLAATFDDPDHSVGEHCLITVVFSTANRLIVVSHSEKSKDLRIISARPATAHERKRHER